MITLYHKVILNILKYSDYGDNIKRKLVQLKVIEIRTDVQMFLF